jgi:hypothetical protein
MPYGFQEVDILAFDFHLMLAPLNGGIQPNAPFDYLVDPNTYNQQYSGAAKTETAHFSFAPLNWRSLSHHHFWKHYQTIQPAAGGKYDFWKLQMPFIGKFKDAIDLVSGLPNVTGTVRPVVFVSGLGWSTCLEISIVGQLTAAELSKFIGGLSSKGAAPFKIGPKRMSLPEVFELLGNYVLSEVYQPKSIDTLKLQRHLIVCPFAATGPVGHYPADQVGAPRISTVDRASLHSVLLGRPVSFAEVQDLERNKKFLVTQFNKGPDFALTYFEKGTLVFMMNTAIAGGAYRRALQAKLDCLLTNIRNYLVMTFSLYNFCIATAGNPTLNLKPTSLRTDLVFTLKSIPNSYNNQFCQSFHKNFTPIGKLK